MLCAVFIVVALSTLFLILFLLFSAGGLLSPVPWIWKVLQCMAKRHPSGKAKSDKKDIDREFKPSHTVVLSECDRTYHLRERDSELKCFTLARNSKGASDMATQGEGNAVVTQSIIERMLEAQLRLAASEKETRLEEAREATRRQEQRWRLEDERWERGQNREKD